METENKDFSAELDRRLYAHRKKKKKKKRLGIASLSSVMAAVAVILAVLLTGKLLIDQNARKKAAETVSKEDLRMELQQQADASGFRVRLNTAPVSKDGETADWCVINSTENQYDMQVVISTAEGTPLYDSGVLPPGSDALVGEVTQSLSPGSYPAVATAYALDRETGENRGEVTVEITLTVEEP